jgi:trimeric autotransporter adhesin
MTQKIIVILLAIACSFQITAQNVGINGTGATANASAGLDVNFSDKGVLVPRVNLVARNSNAPIGATIAASLLVYNLVTASAGVNLVVPGYYYWDGLLWQRVANGSPWDLFGNSGTVAATNFLGTTDNIALTFRTNNIEKMRLSTKGQVELLNVGNSVMVGENAGANDDLTDNRNTFIGTGSNSNATSERNVAIGYNAFATLNFSTAIGYTAIAGNNLANAIGHAAVANGISSIVIGNSAFSDKIAAISIGRLCNSQGDNAIAIGDGAFTNSLRGIALGVAANPQGQDGICIGNQSFTNALHTVAIGTLSNSQSERGIAIGYGAYTANQFTTAIGNGAQAQGNNSLAIGNGATVFVTLSTAIGNGTLANGSNSSAFGNGASATANQIRIGNNAVTSIGGFVNWTNVSDRRIKNNIVENVPGLNFIMKLRPVTYNLNLNASYKIQNRSIPTFTAADSIKMLETQTGFIAQEVESAAKSCNYNFSGVDAPDNENDIYGLRYSEFVVPLVKAVQEQQQLIISMNKEMQALKLEIEQLKKTR